MSEVYEAKFYDISEAVTPGYKKAEIVTGNDKDFEKRITNYLKKNKNIRYGDIIFVGSTHMRQYYGFRLVLDKQLTMFTEVPVNLPITNEVVHDRLKEMKVQYNNLLARFNPLNYKNGIINKGLDNDISKIDNYVFSCWYHSYSIDLNNEKEYNDYREGYLIFRETYKEYGLLHKKKLIKNGLLSN